MLQPRSVTLVQLVCAALGIPAAIAGSYSAYQTYFSNEAVCQRLRTAVVATMERKLPLDAKQALLRKDVADFDKNCGDGDPDARTVFQTAMQERPPAPKARMQLAAADTQLPSAAPARPAAPPVFGTAGAGERSGWIALSRREAGALVRSSPLQTIRPNCRTCCRRAAACACCRRARALAACGPRWRRPRVRDAVRRHARA